VLNFTHRLECYSVLPLPTVNDLEKTLSHRYRQSTPVTYTWAPRLPSKNPHRGSRPFPIPSRSTKPGQPPPLGHRRLLPVPHAPTTLSRTPAPAALRPTSLSRSPTPAALRPVPHAAVSAPVAPLPTPHAALQVAGACCPAPRSPHRSPCWPLQQSLPVLPSALGCLRWPLHQILLIG
jgi:hypothetical protein